MDSGQLSNTQLFNGLSVAEIEDIIEKIPYRIRKFRKGSMISQSGERVSGLMIVLNGVVKGEMVDYAGRQIKIEDIPAPGILAPAFLFGNKNKFPVNVVASEDSVLMVIDKPDFLRLLTKNDTILVNFLDMISNRSQFLSGKIKFLNFKTIRAKLAHYILQRAGKEKSSIKMDMTQNELADYFGVARPSVSRVIGELKDEGYLEVRGKCINIIDKEGLTTLIRD